MSQDEKERKEETQWLLLKIFQTVITRYRKNHMNRSFANFL